MKAVYYVYSSGGTIVAENNDATGVTETAFGLCRIDKSDSSVTIQGGTYAADPGEWVAAGYRAVESNGIWTVEEIGLPVANVDRTPEYENVALPWGSYGAWSPTVGLDSYLEAAYTFSCAETSAEAAASPYADWYCDFYVKLNVALGANQIFLGGNYGSFDWVGFHNGDMTLEANTEIPLLGSVTSNPWTYEDVASFVGTFICGVGDVNDALSGATFTVMLRLTNPVDETEFYNVATINYTFA